MRAGALTAIFLAALFLGACGDDAVSSGSDDSAEAGSTTPSGGNVLRFEMDRLDGAAENLSRYRGKVILVVNTASECGFTPQFEQLQELYESRSSDDFVVLGFPADDVAGQEPRADAAIAQFCRANFGVTFPMFAKVNVTGDDAAPLFKALGEPDWNFNKYLIDRRGELVERWGATTEPDDPELIAAIEAQT